MPFDKLVPGLEGTRRHRACSSMAIIACSRATVTRQEQSMDRSCLTVNISRRRGSKADEREGAEHTARLEKPPDSPVGYMCLLGGQRWGCSKSMRDNR